MDRLELLFELPQFWWRQGGNNVGTYSGCEGEDQAEDNLGCTVLGMRLADDFRTSKQGMVVQLVLRILVYVPASNCVDVCWSDTQSFYQRGLNSYMAIEWKLSEKSIDGR